MIMAKYCDCFIEKGNFLSLDFGGPVISIFLLEFLESSCSVTVQKFTIPPKYMTGKSVRVCFLESDCSYSFSEVNDFTALRLPGPVSK